MILEDKHQYRAPKQARSRQRFDDILRCAERYIEEGRLESFTLLDLVQDADATVGSVYHFFPSKEAVLVALIHRAHDAFDVAVRNSTNRPAETWQDQVRASVTAVYQVYMSSVAARALILGPGYIWPVRLADSARNDATARAMQRLLAEQYDLPSTEQAERRMAQAVTVMDALFRKSVEESLTITEDYLELTREEIVAFLERGLLK